MFAIVAAILFGVALLLVLVGGIASQTITALTLAGLFAVALHLAFGYPLPWRRP